MRHRILAVVLAVAVLLALGAVGANASSTVHLQAAPKMQVWRSPRPLNPNRALSFSIYVHGREVDQLGHVEGACRYTLFTRGLTLEVSNCGRSPITIRYMGSVRFAFRYRQV